MNRHTVPPEELSRPPGPNRPLPGETVRFGWKGRRRTGTLRAHDKNGKFVIETSTPPKTYSEIAPNVVHRVNREEVPPRAFDALSQIQISRATDAEVTSFDRHLWQKVGRDVNLKSVLDNIREHGHEIYVVGGGVRDVILGRTPKDIDLVGTMPLGEMNSLLSALEAARRKVKGKSRKDRKERRRRMMRKQQLSGHVKFGLEGEEIDYCVFVHSDRYTQKALFDANFELDATHRDFTCNSVYYDPYNQVLIDPLKTGLSCCQNQELRRAWAEDLLSGFDEGRIVLRYIKMVARHGFRPHDDLIRTMEEMAERALRQMSPRDRGNHAFSHLYSNCEKREDVDKAVDNAVREIGIAGFWTENVQPLIAAEKTS